MKNYFWLAAASAMVLTSCDKGPGTNGYEKENAKMNVVISFPQPMGTRAADQNASSKDVAVESVTVFVFDQNGKAETGNGTTFAKTDFDALPDNTYKLKTGKRILTTAGLKHIYVGINLPTALTGASSENALIEKAVTTGLEGTNSVAMLSKVAKPILVAQKNVNDPTPAANVVPAVVERLVSKVAVSAGAQATWTPDQDQNKDAPFDVTPDKFSVGGLATTFYPVQRITNGKLVTPGDQVGTTRDTYRDINPNGTAIIALDAFYVPENSDQKGTRLKGDLTYAVIRAGFTFSKFATFDTAIGYETVTTLAPSSLVYTFRVGKDTYFCKSEAEATKIKTALGVTPSSLPSDIYTVDASGKLYTYYHLFLNLDETDRLAVKRNQFFNINVSGVRGLGSPDDTVDPNEPVFEDAVMEVTIDILEWDFKPIDHILGR